MSGVDSVGGSDPCATRAVEGSSDSNPTSSRSRLVGLRSYLTAMRNLLAIQSTKMFGDWHVVLDPDGDHLVYFNSELPEEKVYSNPLISEKALQRLAEQNNERDPRAPGSRWSPAAIAQVLSAAATAAPIDAVLRIRRPVNIPDCSCDGCKATPLVRFEDIFPNHRTFRIRRPVNYNSSLSIDMGSSQGSMSSSSDSDSKDASEYEQQTSSSEPEEERHEHVNSETSSKYKSKAGTEMSALSGVESEGYDVFERGTMLFTDEEKQDEAIQAAQRAQKELERLGRVKKEKTEYDDLLNFFSMLEKRHEQSCSWTVPIPGTPEYEQLCRRVCLRSRTFHPCSALP